MSSNGAQPSVREEGEQLHNDSSSFISEMLSVSDKRTRKANRATNMPSAAQQFAFNNAAVTSPHQYTASAAIDCPKITPNHGSTGSLGGFGGYDSSYGNYGSFGGYQHSFNSGYFDIYDPSAGSLQAYDHSSILPNTTSVHQQRMGSQVRFKTAPAKAWDNHKRKESQEKFGLQMSDLEEGLIVYNPPDGTWLGGHSLLVLDWKDEDHINVLETTTFSSRHITEVFRPHDERQRRFLQLKDWRADPHLDTPAIPLKNDMVMPKPSYIKFKVRRTGKLSDWRKFGDRSSLDNRYVVTEEGMKIVRDFLVEREADMKICEEEEKMELEEKARQAELEKEAEKVEAEKLVVEEEARKMAEEKKKAAEEEAKRKREEMKKAVFGKAAAMKADQA